LAKVEEHLVSLCTGGLNASTNENCLTIQGGRKIAYLGTGFVGSGLRLVERQWAIKFRSKILSIEVRM